MILAKSGSMDAQLNIRKSTKKPPAEQYPKDTRQIVGRLSLTLAICKPQGEQSEQKESRQAKQVGCRIKHNYD